MPAEWDAAAEALRGCLSDLLAVIVHGPAGRGERIQGAPVDLLAVTLVPATERAVRGAAGEVCRVIRDRVSLGAMEAHRIGWLRPSVFQQSLLSGAALLCGDPATITVIPSWRPDQIDPREALLEIATAEQEMSSGNSAYAAYRATGALLLARRCYTPRLDRQEAALTAAWPEIPSRPRSDAAPEVGGVVRDARQRIDDWLFTWERNGVPQAAVSGYTRMYVAACPPSPVLIASAQ